MWWEWWEKQKTNIQQISRTPTSCGSFSLCYFEDAKRQATGPDKFGQSMVTSHSFSPPILDHQVAMLRPSTFYQLPGDWSQTWASFGIQKLVWFIEFFSFDLGKSSFRVLQGSAVSWLLGWSPLFLSIPHATGVFNFRMGLLYFGRWKECKIHGFLHSLLLRWSRDFKPGWELDGKIAMAAGRVRFGMFHHCWCEWIGLRNILQKKHTYFMGKKQGFLVQMFPLNQSIADASICMKGTGGVLFAVASQPLPRRSQKVHHLPIPEAKEGHVLDSQRIRCLPRLGSRQGLQCQLLPRQKSTANGVIPEAP